MCFQDYLDNVCTCTNTAVKMANVKEYLLVSVQGNTVEGLRISMWVCSRRQSAEYAKRRKGEFLCSALNLSYRGRKILKNPA